MTLHSSKGLQFDTVIIPFDDGEISHHSNSDKARYVAMTRAKNKLIILYSDCLATCFSKCRDSNKYEGELKANQLISFAEVLRGSRIGKE